MTEPETVLTARRMMAEGKGMNRTREANIKARNAAPLLGTYLCDDYYQKDCPNRPPAGVGAGHCWHESARRRLEWQYGEARANRIALGIDSRTNQDLSAWSRLGRKVKQ